MRFPEVGSVSAFEHIYLGAGSETSGMAYDAGRCKFKDEPEVLETWLSSEDEIRVVGMHNAGDTRSARCVQEAYIKIPNSL